MFNFRRPEPGPGEVRLVGAFGDHRQIMHPRTWHDSSRYADDGGEIGGQDRVPPKLIANGYFTGSQGARDWLDFLNSVEDKFNESKPCQSDKTCPPCGHCNAVFILTCGFCFCPLVYQAFKHNRAMTSFVENHPILEKHGVRGNYYREGDFRGPAQIWIRFDSHDVVRDLKKIKKNCAYV